MGPRHGDPDDQTLPSGPSPCPSPHMTHVLSPPLLPEPPVPTLTADPLPPALKPPPTQASPPCLTSVTGALGTGRCVIDVLVASGRLALANISALPSPASPASCTWSSRRSQKSAAHVQLPRWPLAGLHITQLPGHWTWRRPSRYTGHDLDAKGDLRAAHRVAGSTPRWPR